MDSLVIPKSPQCLQLNVQKYLLFNSFGKGYLCLLKRFLFLGIRRLYFTWFLREIHGKIVTRTFFGAIFCGAHTVQMVPKYIWMWHCQQNISTPSPPPSWWHNFWRVLPHFAVVQTMVATMEFYFSTENGKYTK